MTTKVHVVNFGPDVVEVIETPVPGRKQEIYPQQSASFYVYEGQDLVVKERKVQTTN